jgi:hypothetical protein
MQIQIQIQIQLQQMKNKSINLRAEFHLVICNRTEMNWTIYVMLKWSKAD